MFQDHVKNIPQQEINLPDLALNVMKQVLVGPAQGWNGWVMRLFTLGKEGYTPRHSHPWPHINYIVSGKGSLLMDGKVSSVEPGSVAYIANDIEHQFKNLGEDDFAFICIVPAEGDV